jgi:DNA polymerase-3 subunit delta'
MLIWLPEYLGKEGNRLLKIIEEPPENTYFLLVAEQADQILNTILSRCQLIKVPALSDEAVQRGLEGMQPGLPPQQIRTAAYLADGNLNEARKILAAGAADQSKMLLDWLRKAYKGNGVEMVAWVEAFAKLGRENQKQFFLYALHFLRELLQVSVLPEDQVRLQDQELKTAQGLLKVMGIEEIDKMIQLFTDTAYYIERNANPKIVMLDCTINLAKVLRPAKAGAA